jgi:hypothetical protein
VFENMMLRGIFLRKGEEVTGGWEKLRNTGLMFWEFESWQGPGIFLFTTAS